MGWECQVTYYLQSCRKAPNSGDRGDEKKKPELPPEFGGTLMRSIIWKAVIFSQVEQREIAGMDMGLWEASLWPDQGSQKPSFS